ncbi:MAG TPA: ParB/RepB/Spo0J family partition protein [Thermoanaerobaculia bacterium]|nr:ParB/RepB/Spo0J family partition protein [Thermoanaerobaculia bacterium]
MSEPARRRGLPQQIKMRHSHHFVDELTARSETPVGKFVPLAEIEPDPAQPRSAMGNLDDLVSSIRDKGILEPLLVRRHSFEGAGAKRDKTHLIISGERRYHAALAAGLFEVPVIELDVSDQEALEIALIENLQRKDLTPFEEAEGYRVLAERHSYTHEQIAEAVGKSRVVITESLNLLQMPARVRDAVQALGVTSKSVLLEILKARSEEEMIQLLERVSSLGMSRDDLRRRSRQPGGRRKPYVFTFKSPDKSYRLNLSFRRSTVDRGDLISALQEILQQLVAEQQQQS